MSPIDHLLANSNCHNEWIPILTRSLEVVDEVYLQQLIDDDSWLPGKSLIFSAFKRNLEDCQYILFGESPYPRAESANGIAFYDAAVTDIWSVKGLSKAVNKATSLRNIMKCALLAEGYLNNPKVTQDDIAALNKNGLTQTLSQFFKKLETQGFLLLNTAPVLHPMRKPAVEARFWQPFIHQLFIELHQSNQHPTLILWGKVAQQIEALPISRHYEKMICEHPYNLSFIQNSTMQTLFAQLKLLTL